jgi:hypothetical protein
VQPDGDFTYVAGSSAYAGNFTITVSNGTISQTVTIFINVTDQAPSLDDMSYTIPVTETINTASDPTGNYPNVLADDIDSNDGSLTITAAINSSAGNITIGANTTLPSGAVLDLQSDGDFTYTPYGTTAYADSFTITVSNGTASTSTATVFINVTDDALVLPDVYYSTYVGQTFDTATDTTGNFPSALSGDFDPNGGTLSVTKVNGNSTCIGDPITLGSGANLTMQSNGNFTYVAPGSAVGDEFTITVTDGSQSETQTVYVDVLALPPVVTDMSYDVDAGQTIDTANATTDNAPNALAYDYDPAGGTLSVTQVGDSAGNTTISGGGSATITLPSGANLTMSSDGDFTYDAVPSTSPYTEDATIKVSNGSTYSYETLYFNVTPSASDVDASLSIQTVSYNVNAGATLQTSDTGDNPGVLFYDSSANGAPMTVTAVNGGSVGTPITLVSGATLTMQSNGQFTYVSVGSASSTDSFTVTVTNGTETETQTVFVNVSYTSVPVVTPMDYTILAGQTLTTASTTNGVLSQAYDPNGATLTVTAVNGGSISSPITIDGGTLTMARDGEFTFAAATSTTGSTAYFTVMVSNGETTTDEDVFIHVSVDPEVQDKYYYVQAGTTMTTSSTGQNQGVLANFVAPGIWQVTSVNGTSVGSAVSSLSGSTLTVQADGNFTYTAPPDSSYDEMFTVTVSNDSQSATINIFFAVDTPVARPENMSPNSLPTFPPLPPANPPTPEPRLPGPFEPLPTFPPLPPASPPREEPRLPGPLEPLPTFPPLTPPAMPAAPRELTRTIPETPAEVNAVTAAIQAASDAIGRASDLVGEGNLANARQVLERETQSLQSLTDTLPPRTIDRTTLIALGWNLRLRAQLYSASSVGQQQQLLDQLRAWSRALNVWLQLLQSQPDPTNLLLGMGALSFPTGIYLGIAGASNQALSRSNTASLKSLPLLSAIAADTQFQISVLSTIIAQSRRNQAIAQLRLLETILLPLQQTNDRIPLIRAFGVMEVLIINENLSLSEAVAVATEGQAPNLRIAELTGNRLHESVQFIAHHSFGIFADFIAFSRDIFAGNGDRARQRLTQIDALLRRNVAADKRQRIIKEVGFTLAAIGLSYTLGAGVKDAVSGAVAIASIAATAGVAAELVAFVPIERLISGRLSEGGLGGWVHDYAWSIGGYAALRVSFRALGSTWRIFRGNTVAGVIENGVVRANCLGVTGRPLCCHGKQLLGQYSVRI